jgi:hypothetical protein
VVIGGKNKYLINGSNVQNSRVSDLFRSVQLNVNNPHFLIMQGRITKVLNMKPPEILAMIEEAAGTRYTFHNLYILVKLKMSNLGPVSSKIIIIEPGNRYRYCTSWDVYINK